jgi:hypothetical protein
MSNRHHWRARRGHSWALVLTVAVVLQPDAPAFATINVHPSVAAAGVHTDVMAERRCKWTPKEERCDWVKRDDKRKTSR